MWSIRKRTSLVIAGLVLLLSSFVTPWPLAAQEVDLVVAATQRISEESLEEHRIDIKRGEFIKTEAYIFNNGSGRSGPFEVGIYLSEDPAGKSKIFEFDVIRDMNLSGSEYILISREYIMPNYLTPARFYWVVVEADYEEDVTETDEKNKKVIQEVNLLCDELALNYSNTYLCPFKEDGFHYDD